jgi:hypothetical protein
MYVRQYNLKPDSYALRDYYMLVSLDIESRYDRDPVLKLSCNL